MKQSNKIFKFTVTIHTALRTYITIYKSQQKLFYKKKPQYFELVMIPIITERMLKPYWALNLGQTKENFCNFYFCFTVLYFIRIDFELLWTKISSMFLFYLFFAEFHFNVFIFPQNAVLMQKNIATFIFLAPKKLHLFFYIVQFVNSERK
jgi:hypothetical protein